MNSIWIWFFLFLTISQCINVSSICKDQDTACETTCKLCDIGCRDLSLSCEFAKSMCLDEYFHENMKKYCPASCGLC
uniref:ShKT domain-containing protein n=1 Tax=Panagrolaimus sp. PS1159 TaxID=55785 RepID=A0AC35GWW9_9BILA